MRCNQQFPGKIVFRRVLRKAQAIYMLTAFVTINRKVKKNLNIIQEDTFEIQFSFSVIQK